jgi:hypothetical protein
VPGAAAAGFEELALGFPVPQHMGFDPGDAAHFTDGVIGLAGDILFHALLEDLPVSVVRKDLILKAGCASLSRPTEI